MKKEEGEGITNKILSKLVAIAVCLTLLFGTVPVFAGLPTEPHPGNAMWIEPSTLSFSTDTVSPGYRFNVTVCINFTSIDPGDYIGAWQFVIAYEKAYLNATGCWYTAGTMSQWFKDAGVTGTMPVTPSFGSLNDTHNYVLHGETWLSGPMVPEGTPGTLSKVEFEIIAAPPKGGDILSYIGFVTTGTPRCKLLNEDNVDVTDQFNYYSATYHYTWAVPPSPYLAVDPTYREYGPYPPSVVGTTFTEDIYIMELSEAWYIVNASFDLTYDSSFLEVLDVTLNTVDWDVAATADYSTPGVISFYVETSQVLGGNVSVGTVTFNITAQGSYPEVYDSPLEFANVKLYDHTLEIPTRPPVEGEVKVIGLLTLPLPWLEVVFTDTGTNNITLGPEPVVGKEFTAEIWIRNLHFAWYLVGVQYRITYCPDLLEVVDVEEGPYLPSFNQTPTPPYTWFGAYIESDGIYGPHILVGELILPNATGQWPGPLPGAEPPEDGLIAVITFKVLKQGALENYTCALNFIEVKLIDVNGDPIPTDTPINGTYNIIGTYYGALRQIDVFGGANNAGYGVVKAPFPDEYSGKGPNAPMDLVIPQSEVYLFALVTYRYWPVQGKEVAFEIIDNHGNTWAKFTAITDSDGIASITIRMPWVCDNPQYYLGEWTVVATTNLADVVISDTLTFHYDYMVRIWKVITDKYYYAHGEYIEVTVNYGTHAMQSYPALFTVTVTDELGVPIGINATYSTMVGGAQYCTYLNNTFTVTIFIPKFAFAGKAYIHVCCFDKEPAEGGFAWCPEAEPVEIYILPESV